LKERTTTTNCGKVYGNLQKNGKKGTKKNPK